MQILALEGVCVEQVHDAAATTVEPGGHHDAVGNRHHRRSRGRAVVDAEVRANLAQHGMQTMGRKS